MPLLGKKIYQPLYYKATQDPGHEHVIEFTQERFADKNEMEARLQLYKAKVWACQSTAKTGMTFQEAQLSEANERASLLRNLPPFYEHSILTYIHHSQKHIDTLVSELQQKFNSEFIPGEKVQFCIQNRSFEATVTEMFPEEPKAEEPKNTINPPTNGATTNGNHQENGENGTPEKKKTGMTPAKYNIYITLEKKVVSKVPLTHLKRTAKPPSRSILLKYIRTHTLRPHIAKKMIVLVDKELVDQHELESKLPQEMITEYLKHSMVDALCRPVDGKGKVPVVNKSPVTMATQMVANGNSTVVPVSQALKEGTLKVVHPDVEGGGEKKMYPMFQQVKMTSPNNKQSPSNAMEGVQLGNQTGLTPFMKSPAVIDGGKRKRGRPRKSDQLPTDGSSNTPSKRQKRVASFQADDISKYMASKEFQTTPPPGNSGMIMGNKPKIQPKEKLKSPRLKKLKIRVFAESPKSGKRGRPKGSLNKKGSKKHQSTLLDMVRKNMNGGIKSFVTPNSSIMTSQKKKKQPYIVRQLVIMKKNLCNQPKSHKYKLLVSSVAHKLSRSQLENLPETVAADVIARFNEIEEKRKVDMMTPEEKKEYRKGKRMQLKMAALQDGNPGQMVSNPGIPLIGNMPVEDQFLAQNSQSKALPFFEEIELPSGLGQQDFSKIVMVVEFVHNYSGLLESVFDKKEGFNSSEFNLYSFMDAISTGYQGYEHTSKLLVLLIKILMLDVSNTNTQLYNFKIKDIIPTKQNACELARACLRLTKTTVDCDVKTESNEVKTESDVKVENDVTNGVEESPQVVVTAEKAAKPQNNMNPILFLNKQTIEAMKSNELYKLTPFQQLDIFHALVHTILLTSTVEDYIEKTVASFRQALKVVNRRKKQELEDLKAQGPRKRGRKSVKKDENQQTITETVEKKIKKEEEEKEDEVGLAGRLKLRKQQTEQQKQIEEEERIKRENEEEKRMEEERRENERREQDEDLSNKRRLKENVMRKLPLGTDRNHNRYWLMSDGMAGLYVEVGWIGSHINYATITQQQVENIKRKIAESGEVPKEGTWPIHVDNKWYRIADMDVFNQLYKALNVRGYREMNLKANMRNKKEEIERLINLHEDLAVKHGKKPAKTVIKAESENGEVKSEASSENGGKTEEVVKITPPSVEEKKMLEDEQLAIDWLKEEVDSLLKEGVRGSLIDLNIHEDEDHMNIYNDLENRIQVAETPKDFGIVIRNILHNFPDSSLRYYFSGVKEKTRKKIKKNETQEDICITSTEGNKADQRREMFIQNLIDVELFSTCCFLFDILNENIIWEDWKIKRKRNQPKRGSKLHLQKTSSHEEEEEEEELDSRRSSRLKSRRNNHSKNDSIAEERPRRNQQRQDYRSMVEDTESSSGEEESEDEGDEEGEVQMLDEEEGSNEDGSLEGEDEEGSEEEDSDEEEEEEEEVDEAAVSIEIVDKLNTYQYTDIFRDPVDRELYEDYYEIIKKPISLSEIRKNASEDPEYSLNNLCNDLRQIVDNAITYNGPDHSVTKDAFRMARAFKKKCVSTKKFSLDNTAVLDAIFADDEIGAH